MQTPSQSIRWAAYAKPPFIGHVSVDHRGVEILMAEQFLYRSNVVAVFEQMRRKRVPQSVWVRMLMDAGFAHRFDKSALHGRGRNVMPLFAKHKISLDYFNLASYILATKRRCYEDI